jgi:N-acetylmuramoyl-L-alanine amidase
MSGAPGHSGLLEKNVNLDIAKRLAQMLQGAGATVFMTRWEDCELRPIPPGDKDALRAELRMRAGLANAVEADIFLSIHSNANARNSDTPRTGTEIYFTAPNSRQLAQTLKEDLVKALGRKDGGIRTCNFVVTREAKMPAVLAEIAYIDNPEEEKLLASEEFRAVAAGALFTGLSRFVESGGLLAWRAAAAAAPCPAGAQ